MILFHDQNDFVKGRLARRNYGLDRPLRSCSAPAATCKLNRSQKTKKQKQGVR